MSKQVDSRVVEMQFDNKKFESNVQTTLSTIDKLKEKLRFKGVEKGLDNLNSSAKKVDMTPLGNGVETVRAKFSALQVMGVTALANITNSAINAGKNIVKSLTIAPVSDGWQEYEMTLNAVQTTMAGTGKTAKEVEKELKKLDEYADKTVYSTADMLNNLPKFTNAGVELEKATTAMIGIANATALAGGDANKASIAFYNLGQAIGTGYLSRMDYNSINNAGIATMEWKEQMVQAAIAQGTLTKVGEDSYKSGKKTYTLQQLFIDGLQTQWATTDVLMEVFEDYGDETTDIGKKSYSAAQDIKTFSQMMESLKATAGTGWKDTWQIIFGGLDEAKEFWTGLSNFISSIITKTAKVRNELLEGALGKTFTGLSKKINEILKPAKAAAKSVEGATKAVKDLGKVVDEVIIGKFGNGKTRVDALTKAGYNYAEVQNKVNEKLGVAKRHTVTLDKAQSDLNKTQEESDDTQTELSQTEKERLTQLVEMSDAELENLGYTKDQISAFRELKKEADKLGMTVGDFIDNIDKLNGRTILINTFKNIGDGIVKTFQAMATAWKNVFPPMTSETLYNIIAGMHKLSTNFVMSEETSQKLTKAFEGLFSILKIATTLVGGPMAVAFKLLLRVLELFDIPLLDLLANVGDGIKKFSDWLDRTLDFSGAVDSLSAAFKRILSPFKEVKDALAQLFPRNDIGDKAETAGEKIEDMSDSMDTSKRAAENFKTILEGIESLLTGISYVISKSLLGSIKLLDAILGLFDTSLADIIGKFAEFLTSIKDGTNEHILLANSVNKVAQIITAVATGIKEVVTAFWELPQVQKIIENLKNAWANLFNADSFEGVDINKLVENISNVFTKLINWIKGLKDSENIGMDIMRGLAKGLSNGVKWALSNITSIVTTIIDTVKTLFGINSPSVVFAAIGGFLIAGLIAGLKGNSSGVLGTLKDIGKGLIDAAKNIVTNLLDMLGDISLGEILFVGIIAGLAVTVKKVLDIGKAFGRAADGFAKAASGAGNLMNAFAEKLNPKKNKFETIATNMIKMAAAIAILAGSVYLLAQLKPGELWSAVGAVTALAVVVGGLAIAMDKLNVSGADFGKITLLVLGISGAMLMLSKVMKTLSGMEWSEFGKAATGIGGMIVFLSTMMLITKIGNTKKVGKMLLEMAGAIVILTFVAKSLAKMEWSEMGKAAAGLGGLVVVMGLLMLITKIGNAKKVGNMLLKISGAIAVLAVVIKLLSGMEWSEFGKAAVGVGGLLIFVSSLMLITKIGNFKKVGSMLLQMSAAIAILAVTARIIAGMEWSEMGKAAVGLAGLAAIIAGLIWATNLAGGNDLKGVGTTLLAVSGAIAILAGLCIILGMIDPTRLAQGLIAVVTLGALMALLLYATSYAQECKGTLIALTVAIAVLAGAVAALSFIEPTKLLGASAALSILMGMMALLAFTMGHVQKAVGTIVAMTVCVGVLAGALYLVASLPAGTALPAAIALGGVMLALSAALFIINKVGNVSVSALAAVTVIGLAVLALAGALAVVAAIPTANALVAALALSAVMLALAGALAILSNFGGMGAVAGAAAIIIVAGALAILTPCIQMLGSMSWGQIAAGLVALAGGLLIIIGAGALAQFVAVGLLALGAAVLLIGVGILSAALGFQTFATALSQFMLMAMSLAGQGPVITAGILAIITGICGAIVGGVAAITGAIVAVVTGICNAIIILVPKVLQTIGVMITSFLEFIVEAVPQFVEAGMQMITGILQGIADNIGDVIESATDIIVNFLEGIGQNLPRIIDAGFKMIISFINGMADSIRNNTGSMISAVNNLMDAVIGAIKAWFTNFVSKGGEIVGKIKDGVKSKFGEMKQAAKDMMQGFVQGIKDKFGAIKDAAVNAVKGGVDKVKSWLGIASPSKLMASFGKFTMQGYANGVKKQTNNVTKTMVGTVSSAVEAMRDFLGIHSPADETFTDGLFTALGFIRGMEKSLPDVKAVGSETGAAVTDGIKKELSSKVLIENGKYIVKGISDGIKNDTSAEDAATKKAQNITNAFKTVFDSFDLDSKSADLEYELWESLNPSASDIDKASMQAYYESSKIPTLEAAVSVAKGKYDTMVETFGESSEEAQKALNELVEKTTEYNNALEEQRNLSDAIRESRIDQYESYNDITDKEYSLWEKMHADATDLEKAEAKLQFDNIRLSRLTNELAIANEGYTTAVNSYGQSSPQALEAYDAFLDVYDNYITAKNDADESMKTIQDILYATEQSYYKWMQQNMSDLFKEGKTYEQILELGKLETGYDINNPGKAEIKRDAAGNILNPLYEELQIGITPVVDSASLAGSSYTAGFAVGIQNGSSEVANTMATTLQTAASTIQTNTADFIASGEQIISGIIQGMRNGAENVTATILEMVTAACAAADQALSSESQITLRPVIDWSGMNNDLFLNNQTLHLASVTADISVGKLDTLPDIFDKMNSASATRDSNMLTAINNLRKDFGELTEAISHMHIRMDSGAVVGELIGKIDNGLGSIATHKGRGN